MLIGRLLPMLFVAEVSRSVAFYRDVLGFEFAGWWDDASLGYVPDPPADVEQEFAELIAGDRVLHLHWARDEPLAGGGSILHLKVKDADAYFDQVRANGGRFDPPADQPWGWRQFYASDPDGHRWSFSHELSD